MASACAPDGVCRSDWDMSLRIVSTAKRWAGMETRPYVKVLMHKPPVGNDLRVVPWIAPKGITRAGNDKNFKYLMQ